MIPRFLSTQHTFRSREVLSAPSKSISTLRSGTVLIIVLVAMTLLALSAYTFSNLMLDHRKSLEAVNMRSQSDAAVASGADAIRAFLMQPRELQQQQGGVFDNQAFFSFQTVVNDPSPQFSSQFSVLSTELGDTNAPSSTRFGMIDESSKINLNDLVAKEEDPSESTFALLVLPGMTVEIADAILDWIDGDVEPREYGAESADVYSALEPPRTPSDGPIHSLSELLLVRGVTPQMLYGMDTNRNGQVEPEEAQLATGLESLTGTAGDDIVTASMELGWSAYLTVYGRERNVDPQGNYRININMENLEELHAQITNLTGDEDVATFIVAYRQSGPTEFEEEEEEADTGGEAGGGGGGGQQQNNQQDGQGGGQQQLQDDGEEEVEPEEVNGRSLDLTIPAEVEFVSEADLFDAFVETTFDGEDEPVLVRSPFVVGDDAILDILPYLTITDERAISGRININQAPRPVLATLRDLETEAIEQILAVRQQRNIEQFGRAHPIWLVYDEIVDIETMREIMPFVTAGGDVYSADIVASTGDGNAVRRARVVFDATRPEVPQLVWKDKEFLGRGFPREVLINPDAQLDPTAF